MPGVKVRISQCMIVKNEERNIERALSWGRNVMWEQIVIDTGSEDRTVEIARKLGAKVCFFPWTDDFAAAKNYAIQQCGGEWVAFLDADEYMTAEDVKKLPQIIETLNQRKLDGLSTAWQQLDDKGEVFACGTQVRFFRNIPDIRYRRRIHEQLESVSGRELRLGDGVKELSILHTGYQSNNLGGKSERNRKMILKELEENPEDYEMMGYMGDEYLSDDDREKARMWYCRAIEHMPLKLGENDQRSAATFTRLLMMFSQEENVLWESVCGVYEKAVKRLPHEADFDYAAGYFLAMKGQYERAVFYLEEALRKLDSYGSNNKALFLAGNLPETYELLVRCCYEAGQREKCASYGTICLKNNRYNMAVLSKLLLVLLHEGSRDTDREYGAVAEFLSHIYDFSLLKDKVFLVKTADVSGREEFSAFVLKNLFTKDERSLLGK